MNGTLKYIAKAKVKYMIDEPKSESSKRDILMLDNLVTVLREHRKRQLATRMLLGDKWRPELGFEKGIPPKVMQEILGHKSITMTLDIYSHVLPDKKAEEINKLAAMF